MEVYQWHRSRASIAGASARVSGAGILPAGRRRQSSTGEGEEGEDPRQNAARVVRAARSHRLARRRKGEDPWQNAAIGTEGQNVPAGLQASGIRVLFVILRMCSAFVFARAGDALPRAHSSVG